MRLYNSPRVTHDLDLAVRTLDIDKITELMYEYGYYLVTAVENDSAQICLSADEANQWIIDTKSGSTTFIGFEKTQPSAQVALQEIDITTQIDYLFEPGIPVMRLKKNAKKVPIDDFFILLASVPDLLALKENRPDKNGADYTDIQFLKDLLWENK